jgi:imidazolonepropionase-like amidohydrolase
MKRLLEASAVLLGVAVPLAAQAPSARPPAPPSVFAITNTTIVPVTGPRVAGGTVVIRDGKIEAAGANVATPVGATVIDGSGLFLYPGMIDSGDRMGLVEIGSVPGGQDTQELGQYNPHNAVLSAVNPSSVHVPITRANGVTTALTSAQGGMIQGWAALIDLVGWTPDEMAQNGRVAMVMTYPSVGGGRGRGGFRGGQGPAGDAAETQSRQVRELYDYLREAKAYNARSNPVPQNLAFAALGPALRGEVPVIFDVQTEGQIRGVLALSDTFKLKPVLRGATESWMLADTLAARKVPVIVGPLTAVPSGDAPYDAVYAYPGVLAKAGVLIAFQTDDGGEGDARNLPYNAALATAYGLDPEEGLRAVTINPARIWGVADRLGSIEAGKVANLFLTTGDPLDVRSQVREVFIRGQRMPWDDRHTAEYQKWRSRPPP